MLVLPPEVALTSTVIVATFDFRAAGDSIVQIMVVAQFTAVAATFPNLKTVVLPISNPLPVTVTGVSPALGPVSGLTFVSVGASNVNFAFNVAALLPLGVVTATSTVPVDPAGDSAVIDVAELTVKPTASVGPKSTDVAPVRLAPLMVTVVPPAAGPLAGDTLVTNGAGPAGVANTHAAPVAPLS